VLSNTTHSAKMLDSSALFHVHLHEWVMPWFPWLVRWFWPPLKVLDLNTPGVMMAQWYSPFWDAGTSKRSWVETQWSARETPSGPLPTSLTWGSQLLVRSAVAFQKRKKCGYKQLYAPWGHLVNSHKKQVPHHQTMYFGPIDKPNCSTKVSLFGGA